MTRPCYDSDEIEEFAKHENSRLACFYAYGMNQHQSSDNSMYSKRGLFTKAERCLLGDFEELVCNKDTTGLADKIKRVIEAFSEQPKTRTSFCRRLFKQIFMYCDVAFIVQVLAKLMTQLASRGRSTNFKKILPV